MAFCQSLGSLEAGFSSLMTMVLGFFCCVRLDSNSRGSPKYAENSNSESEIGSSLQEIAEQVGREFDFTGEDLRRGVKGFIQQMNDGLRAHGSTIEQLPSFITKVPTGVEKGTYLAVDMGGTNLRVCSVTLHGDGTHSMIQSKMIIPSKLMVSKSSKDLFSFTAKAVDSFLKSNYPESFTIGVKNLKADKACKPFFNLGFTFSHAVSQLDIDRGTLIRWSKGFDIEGVVGQDVCALLQTALDELQLPVRVTALINDAVGTLMARAYASPFSAHTIMGAVFGTGSNGAYVEKMFNITKLSNTKANGARGIQPDALMIVNTEWGNFDRRLEFLPNTPYDMAVDSGSVNPGFEMYEKRISGMYLGEILRQTILSLVNQAKSPIFSAAKIPENSQLYLQWGINSEFMSILESDSSERLAESRSQVQQQIGISGATLEDAKTLKTISHAIGRRAARLSAIALGAVVLQTKSLGRRDVEEGISKVDIGVDGSLIEMYPGFMEEIKDALREIHEVGIEGEKKIDIAIAKDGSGVGAALTALIAAAPG